MQLHDVKSSNISRLGYDPATSTMRVEFTSGSTYDYPGVAQHEFDSLKSAKSIGTHFATHIRPKFTGKKL